MVIFCLIEKMEKDVLKMKKKLTKSFIRGMGSVIDVMPRKKYNIKTYLPTQTSRARLGRDWERIGETISNSISIQSNAQR